MDDDQAQRNHNIVFFFKVIYAFCAAKLAHVDLTSGPDFSKVAFMCLALPGKQHFGKPASAAAMEGTTGSMILFGESGDLCCVRKTPIAE